MRPILRKFHGLTPLFKYTAGDSLLSLGGTFTNASANRAYIDRNGVLQFAAANVLRDGHYINGVRYALLEGARTNLQPRSQDFSNALWLVTGTDVKAAGIAGAPDGTATANTYVPSTTNTTHNISYNASGPAAGTYTWSIFAKSFGYPRIGMRQFDGTSYYVRATFDVSAGTIVDNQFGTARITPVGNGWYRCSVSGTSVGASSTFLSIDVLNASSVVQGSFAGDGISGMYLWGAMCEAGTFPSSYIATTSASVTRTIDTFSAPITWGPQSLTMLVSWAATVGFGSAPNSPAVVIGANSTVGNRLEVWQNNTTTGGGSRGAHSGTNTTALANAANLYDAIESMIQVDQSGNIITTQSLLAASPTITAATAGPTLETTFASQIVSFGARTAAGSDYQALIRKVVIAPGVQSLATMRTF